MDPPRPLRTHAQNRLDHSPRPRIRNSLIDLIEPPDAVGCAGVLCRWLVFSSFCNEGKHAFGQGSSDALCGGVLPVTRGETAAPKRFDVMYGSLRN
ncbi:hypothetical protein, partial [Streptomyces sp. NPDC059129]|uniref:hypothetical protein n=1 Tax=unclassified Streptomyces TaxID=2593676 RepID=UPI003696022E